jgi:hypothetical protein
MQIAGLKHLMSSPESIVIAVRYSHYLLVVAVWIRDSLMSTAKFLTTISPQSVIVPCSLQIY